MNEKKWNGYTIDELRYMRALSVVKCEMQKEKLISSVALIKQNTALLLKPNSRSGYVGKLLSAFDFFDYAFISFKLVRKLYRFYNRQTRSKE